MTAIITGYNSYKRRPRDPQVTHRVVSEPSSQTRGLENLDARSDTSRNRIGRIGTILVEVRDGTFFAGHFVRGRWRRVGLQVVGGHTPRPCLRDPSQEERGDQSCGEMGSSRGGHVEGLSSRNVDLKRQHRTCQSGRSMISRGSIDRSEVSPADLAYRGTQHCRASPSCVLFDRLKRVVLIVLALFVLVPSMARAAALYECAVDGEVRTTCCCPSAARPTKASHREDASQHLKAASCCKLTQVRAGEPTPRSVPATFESAAPAIVPTTIVTAPIVAPVRLAVIDHSHAPRGPPEALFVRHCALLL